ncbi:17636_t:CDS:2 [Gigaspora margarita]|uniref:17636_t:CDS:1 n=1 Tax=Gigaspora margarita TaxID=4874 RepID=A0ABM8VXE4_GIGMA|nr:17636_t:CDS:2 [Gigaspora margarita]
MNEKKTGRSKKIKKISSGRGVINGYFSFNNTILNLMAEKIAEEIIKRADDYGIRKIDLQVRNPGTGREVVIKKICEAKTFEVAELIDKTPLAFNGTRPRKKPLFALGGLQEVGKNCYCIEKNEDLIIVDYGVLFVNNNNLADGAIPDFTYLQENRQKIKGLFVTHAHEDHIGGLPYLLQLLPNIPVYGSEFSISFLKQKLGTRNKERLIIFSDDTVIRTNEFRVSFFRVTHSIPGAFGLIVEAIEDQSQTGEKTDLAKLAEVGKKGVDLLLSESTNAEIEGNTPSEVRVIKRLESIITEASGRVIITSFASNVYRLKKVIEIAQKTEKKIALLGSSLLRMMRIIQKASL